MSSGRTGTTVGEVMLARPKVLDAAATVGECRRQLDDAHVHMVLLTDGRRLAGTVVRDDLPGTAADDDPALPHAVLAGRTTTAPVPAASAHAVLEDAGARRLAVVDDLGYLLGLLCLKRRRTGFCSDDDVRARSA